MGSVVAIYACRLLTSFTALKLYALILSAVGIAALVSISNVFFNFTNVVQGGLPNTATFIVSAVLGTTFLVQLVLLLGALASLSLCRDLLRTRLLHHSVVA